MAEKLTSTYALVGQLTMGYTDHFECFIVCTHNPPSQFPHNIQKQKLTNRNSKTQTKMAHQNDNMDLEMENEVEQPTRRMLTHSSAHLVEKLKKLKETPKPNSNLMDSNPKT